MGYWGEMTLALSMKWLCYSHASSALSQWLTFGTGESAPERCCAVILCADSWCGQRSSHLILSVTDDVCAEVEVPVCAIQGVEGTGYAILPVGNLTNVNLGDVINPRASFSSFLFHFECVHWGA